MTERVIKILPSMIKTILFIIAMVTSMAFFIGNINKANAASPKQSVIVTGENITLGDVFDGIDDKNVNFVLAPAPLPNVTLTWDAKTLNRISNAFNLQWRASGTDQIRIQRLANIITKNMIAEAITQSLAEKDLKGNYELEFVGQNPQIILPHEMQTEFEVVSSSYNPSRQTFSAAIKTADNKMRNFTGVTHNLIDIPVLKNPLRRGEIITSNMVENMQVRADYIKDNIVLSSKDLIGMTPRKVLRANAPVEVTELDKPQMVSRGDLVTMQLKNGPIQITALAKAMENGTKGDVIRLMNVDSKRTLEAEVTGLREATVYN